MIPDTATRRGGRTSAAETLMYSNGLSKRGAIKNGRKGIEILQIALASGRPNRGGIVLFAAFVLVACILAAFSFVYMQDQQAMSLGTRSEIP